MLASQGIEDADERVLHQLMDFSHRELGHYKASLMSSNPNRNCSKFTGYTTDLLTDAKTYANHAGRPGTVETTDVEMAVQTRSGYEFTEGAPKDVSIA
jgi:transcription initiation factor TFIID subunit 9B